MSTTGYHNGRIMFRGFTRGSKVLYRGRVYYFQPNGLSSYLYDRPEDVGHPNRAAYRPGLKQLGVPSAKDIEDFFKYPRPLRDYPPRNINLLILPYNPNRVTVPAKYVND